jgi:Asp/Glu/hydantoin racemase
MPPTVLALHTNFALVEPIRKLSAELLPGVRVVNLVDDSLLADVRAAGRLTPAVTRRMMLYCLAAQADGADAILSCCSSVGEAVDVIRAALDISIVKIDEPMAEEAIGHGPRVGVIATLATTLDPTARLIESKAVAAGRPVAIRRYLVDGAFDALVSGDAAAHDRLVLAEIGRASAESDVVVLSQGSMARLVESLGDAPGVPVLSSPRRGVAAVRRLLGL